MTIQTSQDGPLDRAFSILEFIAGQLKAVTVADIGKSLDLPLPTAHRLVGNLEARGLVQRAGYQAICRRKRARFACWQDRIRSACQRVVFLYCSHLSRSQEGISPVTRLGIYEAMADETKTRHPLRLGDVRALLRTSRMP